MSSDGYNVKDGRIWFQKKRFEPYKLLLPYGMTSIVDPAGAINPVREPSPSTRGVSVVVDVIRGEPGLPGFQLETRLYKTFNYMLGLRKRMTNFQAHLGACDRPDKYHGSQIGLVWERVHRGDANIDRVNIVQGDNAPIAMTSPFMAELGPLPIDFLAKFVSARPIPEPQAITDIAMLLDECGDDDLVQFEPGDNGYLATEAGATVYAIANVWYTTNAWNTAAQTSTNPFTTGEDISAVLVSGIKEDHRVMVFRGTADLANPAEMAYADVSEMGTTSWVYSNIGSVAGQYIVSAFFLDWTHVYATTNNGYVYMSENGGASWTLKYSSGVVSFNDIAALRDGTVMVVGATNVIRLSEDFGDNWTSVTGPTDGAGDNLLAVDITPDGTIFIGNAAGELYGTADEGDTWHTLELEGITPTSVKRIRHYGNSNIWVVAGTGDGGRVLRSTDSGASFRLWSLAIPDNSGVNALFVINQDYVMVGGEPHTGAAFLTKTKSNVVGFVVRLLD